MTRLLPGTIASSGTGEEYLLESSLRFRGAENDSVITKRFKDPTNSGAFTLSTWIKLGSTALDREIFAVDDFLNGQFWFDSSGGINFFNNGTYVFRSNASSSRVLKDFSAWYHIVLACDDSQSDTNKVRLYVNNEEVTAFSTDNRSTFSRYTSVFNKRGRRHTIGALRLSAISNRFDGYMSDFNFVDGQQLTPSYFAETSNTTGAWNPKRYTGSYGNNGFNLQFEDATSIYTLGKDSSQSTTVAADEDQYMSAVTLLVQGSNNNNQGNGTFIDSSSNSHTITRYGNTTQGTFSPFYSGGNTYNSTNNIGSGFFDGSGDYLTIPDSATFSFGSGDFTIECWAKTRTTNGSTSQPIITQSASGASSDSSFYLGFGTDASIYVSDGTGWDFSATSSVNTYNDGEWHHIASVRNGTELAIYVDGTKVGTTTLSGGYTLGNSTRVVEIGYQTSGTYYNGYISNLRVTKGVARYTSNFTPSMTNPLTTDANASLLLNFANGKIIDGSQNLTAENYSGSYISTSVTKYNSGSIYCSGASGASGVRFSLTTGQGMSSSGVWFNAEDFTAEAWVHPTASGNQATIMGVWDGAGGGTGLSWIITTSGSTRNLRFLLSSNGSSVLTDTSSSSPLNLNAWNHVALVKYNGVIKLYHNGTSVAQYNIGTTAIYTGSGEPFHIGRTSSAGQEFFGYIDDVRITKGVARYTGNFTPPAAAHPNKGPLFAIPSTSTFSLTSGSTYDLLKDSPVLSPAAVSDTGLGAQVYGNYCTANPIDTVSYSTGGLAWTNSRGSLRLETNTNSDSNSTGATFLIPPNSGKWYYEVTFTQFSLGGSGFVWLYLRDDYKFTLNQIGYSLAYTGANPWGNYGYLITTNGSESSAAGLSLSAGDVFNVAVDSNTRKVWFGINGSWHNSGNPSAGTGNIGTIGGSSPISIIFGGRTGSTTQILDLNFGQRPYSYTAPTGFKALCTANLPTPSIIKPETAFETVLYAGNSNAAYSVSGLSFSPDFVWIKNRTLGTVGSSDHMIFDSIRGAQNYIKTNSTDTQASGSNFLTAFTSDGFTPGTSTRTNETGNNYAAWAWDAGSATVTNNDGSVTSNVRVNQTAGFSVVQYNTGNNSNTYTVGHGLGAVPRFIMIKGGYTTDLYNWDIYHAELSPTVRLIINSTTATQTQAGPWDNQRPSSTVVYQNNQSNGWYGANRNNIAYCFTDVPGYSRFGTWNNNNSNNGSFVHLGFRPKIILLKNSDDVEQWYIMDSKRHTFNILTPPDGKNLQPSTSNSEGQNSATTATIDFLSNGFRIRTGNPASGEISFGTRKYVYAAFAESPFKYARAR